MRKKRKVQSLEEIPKFRSEEEEARFWAEHELDEPLLEAMAPPPDCLLYTSPSPRDVEESRMPSSA